MRATSLLLSVICAFVLSSVQVSAQTQEVDKVHYHVSAVGASWDVRLPIGGFTLIQEKSEDKGKSRYVWFENRSAGMNVSLWLEPTYRVKSAKKYIRTSLQTNESMKAADDLTVTKRGIFDLIEYTIKEADGFRQRNAWACYFDAGYWVDIHLSEVLFGSDDGKHLPDFLDSIEIVALDRGPAAFPAELGQSPTEFEGVLTYRLQVKSLTPKMSDEEAARPFGKEERSYYRRGNEKVEVSDGLAEMYLYRCDLNREFMQLRGQDRLLVYDGAKPQKGLSDFATGESNETILGYPLRFVIMRYDDGTEDRLFFGDTLPVDPRRFADRRVLHQNRYYERACALPLRHEMQGQVIVVTKTATKIEERQLSEDLFKVPPLPQEQGPPLRVMGHDR